MRGGVGVRAGDVMTPLQTIVVAVRLFAIWIGLTLFTLVPSAWAYVRGSSLGLGTTLSIAGALVGMVAVALFLWWFPLTVARRLLPGALSEPKETQTSPEEWFLVGTRLMGLWILTRALPTLAFQIAYLYLSEGPDAERMASPPTRWSLVPQVLQAVVGLALLFGAEGLLGLLRLARRTGAKNRGPVNEGGDPA